MTPYDLNCLCWPAMRYALGRKTYVVDSVCRTLIRNAKDIRPDVRFRMVEEISKAIDCGNAGMDMDVEQWLKVIEIFKEEQDK